MFKFIARRIFDILVLGGILFLTMSNEETGWKLIGLGVFGFFAYILLKKM